MDIDDNDAQQQNLHIVGEDSSKVSPSLHSYSLPKFEFDDSLQGHLRFDNLVDNEAFRDNNWIEEYSTAVKSTRKNVWSEATSSESVAMLLNSVGQEEKVLEESNTHIILTSNMDPKGELESVVLDNKNNSSVVDDVNQDASKIATESFVNELQEDSSVSKLEFENAGSAQDVENVDGCNNEPDNSTNSDTIVETRTYNVENLAVVLNLEPVDKSLVDSGVSVPEESVGKTSPKACSSPEIPDFDIKSKDEKDGNMGINAVETADNSKNVEGVVAIDQTESDMNVSTDADNVVKSSKISYPDAPSGTVTSNIVIQDSPKSPIFGVSLLSDDNKEKVEVKTSEGTFQKLASEVEKNTVSDGVEKFVHLNAGQSEQIESGSQLDPKESMKGEDGSKSLNSEVDISNQQQTSVVDASASQSLSLSKNIESSVGTHGSQLNPIKLHEDSPVSQPPISTATKTGAKRNSARKPRKNSVETETTKQTNNLKEKTPSKRSRKSDKSPTMLTTPPATGHVTPVSNPKTAGVTPISTSNLPVMNNSTSVLHQSFTDNQQVQLRAQILVYGSVLSGIPPEEPHMIAAFGQSDGGRKFWEATWHAYIERARVHKAQPNNLGSSTPNQGSKISSAQNKIPPNISSPIVNPVIPVSSPLWNIPTPSGGSQSNSIPKSNIFDPYQTSVVHNFAGHNPMWLSQGSFPGQQGPFPGPWAASSPVASFNTRLSSLPITESVKLTTVKESGSPSLPVVPVGPPMVSSGQTSSGPKSRKRKTVATSSHFTTPTTLSAASTHGQPHGQLLGQPSRVDQNIGQIVMKENIVSKIEESKVQAADAAVHAAAAVNHCQNVWSQLKSQQSSGLVSDDEAKLASSAVSIAAASSVAKVAAIAAKIASNVAEQARLMADEVLLSNKTDNVDQIRNTSSIISAAKEAARRRIEAASASSKHAENLDAIVKAAELAAEAVSQAGKIVAIGNPLSLQELIEAGPEGYWKSPESSSQQGHPDKQNLETAVNDSDLSKTVGIISKAEFGSSQTSDVDHNMPQSSNSNNNIIKEGCFVEVRKDSDKKKSAWFAANVTTIKDGNAFVCYTELLSDDGSGKLKEWVPLESEDTEPPRIRVAHPMTTMRSEGTRKRDRTTLTNYNWCSGDRVDVWVQDCWCEAIVVETNKIDLTSLVVKFPAQVETSTVRSWHVRPTLIWKDGTWVEWSSLNGSHISEGDTPNEKRHKIGSPVVEVKDKGKSSNNINLVESSRPQESKNIPLSSKGSSFNLGQSGRNENKFDTRGTTKSGLQKKQSRVVFGVPKPGKKQKFINMSSRDVDDNNNKNNKSNNNNNNNTPSDSVRLVIDLTPQPSGAVGSETNSKTDSKEKQVVEVKPEVKPKVKKSRKPPVPTLKSLTQKNKSKSSKPTSRDTSADISSGQPNRMDVDSSTTEVKDRSTSESEPRRSVRRIQPTSRLLEGLQSSLTVSHASPRSHKVTSKGSTNSS